MGKSSNRFQPSSPLWLRAGMGLFYAAGLGIMFYGLVIFNAALVTFGRGLPSPDRPPFSTLAEELLHAENVARQGIYLGLSIAAVGFALLVIGGGIQRFRHRQLVLEARQRDVEAYKNRHAGR